MSEDNKSLEKLEVKPTFPSVEVKEFNPTSLRLFACPNCGKMHFRHAGYVKPQTPYVEASDPAEVKSVLSKTEVMLCVSCKSSYISYDGKVYDITSLIDLKAWEKTEVEAHKATGPGGQC